MVDYLHHTYFRMAAAMDGLVRLPFCGLVPSFTVAYVTRRKTICLQTFPLFLCPGAGSSGVLYCTIDMCSRRLC